jgi:nucleotide-binding universal stress UspA family protein
MFHPHTILHPTDFSPNSQNALHVAADLARTYDADLIILHVHPIPVAMYGEGILPPIELDERQPLYQELQRFQVPGVHTTHRLVDGDPVTEILNVAKDHHADVIVMGTHGRRGLKRMLMGSVAELVVRRAMCPVLTIHTPRAEPIAAEARKEPVEVAPEWSA